jgi:hypothetical protein
MLLAFIVLLSSPTLVQIVRGRPGSIATREQRLVAGQDRLDAQRERYLAQLEAARTALERTLREVEADRDEGWDIARGMRDVARDRRHDGNGALAQVAGLLLFIRFMVDGKRSLEDAQRLLDTTPQPVELPPVPELRDVERKSP